MPFYACSVLNYNALGIKLLKLVAKHDLGRDWRKFDDVILIIVCGYSDRIYGFSSFSNGVPAEYCFVGEIPFKFPKHRRNLLADRTSGRAYDTVLQLRPSSSSVVVVCDVMYCG